MHVFVHVESRENFNTNMPHIKMSSASICTNNNYRAAIKNEQRAVAFAFAFAASVDDDVDVAK